MALHYHQTGTSNLSADFLDVILFVSSIPPINTVPKAIF
jgi:hypothetical protein